MLYKISTNVAEVIPYEGFEEKIRIVAEELRKGRYVEIMDDCKLIYSARRWGREYGKYRKIYLQAR